MDRIGATWHMNFADDVILERRSNGVDATLRSCARVALAGVACWLRMLPFAWRDSARRCVFGGRGGGGVGGVTTARHRSSDSTLSHSSPPPRRYLPATISSHCPLIPNTLPSPLPACCANVLYSSTTVCALTLWRDNISFLFLSTAILFSLFMPHYDTAVWRRFSTVRRYLLLLSANTRRVLPSPSHLPVLFISPPGSCALFSLATAVVI